jgi:hypothetical protein
MDIKTYVSELDDKRLMGFKGTSQMGDRILDLEGNPIAKEGLKEGTQFTEFMFGGVFTVTPVGGRFCGQSDGQPDLHCSLEFNEDHQCWWGTGYWYWYCPHLPLTNTPKIVEPEDEAWVPLDPETFDPRKGILTRYGKKLLREGARFYSRTKIDDFVV